MDKQQEQTDRNLERIKRAVDKVQDDLVENELDFNEDDHVKS